MHAQAARVPQYSVENTTRVGSLLTDNGTLAGTAFLVDERGYVATCLSNVINAKEAMVVFDAKTRPKVAGFVAASRSYDVAILALHDPPDDDKRFQRALDLRSDVPLDIDDELVPWGGPQSVAAQPMRTLPKLVRILRGDEYCIGVGDPSSDSLGCHAAAQWLWLSQTRHASCNGAPVFDRIGHVVAMLSAGPNRQTDIFSAIRIGHVMDLIPTDDLKPRPLKTLKGWIDPLRETGSGGLSIPPQSAATASHDQSSLAGLVEYGWPLARRFKHLQERAELAYAEKSKIEQGLAIGQENHLELLAQADAIDAERTSIVPEEPFTTTETTREPRTREVMETVRRSDGTTERVRRTETVMESVTRTVTRFRFSARQREQIQAIDNRLDAMRSKIEASTLKTNFDTKIRMPLMNRIVTRIEDQFFDLADPLGLRTRVEHLELAGYLSELIDEGGASGDLYLARGMTRIHLGDYRSATSDLKEAYDIHAQFRPLARALHARILGLESSHEKAVAALKVQLRENKNNARLFALAARIEMDEGNWSSAVRYLQQAQQADPQSVEWRLGLSWLYSAGTGTNSKTAVEMAIQASEMTGYQDWSSLAALANAHAIFKRADSAQAAMRVARDLAPESAREQCTKWADELAHGNVIKRDWKRTKVAPGPPSQ